MLHTITLQGWMDLNCRCAQEGQRHLLFTNVTLWKGLNSNGAIPFWPSLLQIGKQAPPSPTKDRRNSMGSPSRGPNSPVRRISRVEKRYDGDEPAFRFKKNTWLLLFFFCFYCSPSGEKKVLEQKSSTDINGYQIRVWTVNCFSN